VRTEPPIPAETRAAIRAALTPGAEVVDAPILQPLGLLLDLAGEAMRARLFVVQAEGGAELCLRPDFTVAVARRHLEGGTAAGRYFYEGRAFRASPDTDRPEEFVQMGVELFAPLWVMRNHAWRTVLPVSVGSVASKTTWRFFVPAVPLMRSSALPPFASVTFSWLR